MSAKDALNRYYARQMRPKRRTRNAKPEKDLALLCMAWMRAKGWSVQIVEAKNTYNPRVGRWVSSSVSAGTPDCLGNLPNGISCAIEFKAPGKLRTFSAARNHRQRDFINDKINSFCFAAVVDSVDRLEKIFNCYQQEVLRGKEAAKQYLLLMLP